MNKSSSLLELFKVCTTAICGTDVLINIRINICINIHLVLAIVVIFISYNHFYKTD